MEQGRRSGDPSGFVVKNRNSSGCLIVRKKGGDVGRSGSHKMFESKKEKKRLRMHLNDSGSSDELLMPARRRVGPETIRVCNGLSVVEESDIMRETSRVEDVRRNAVGAMGMDEEDLTERKRSKLDVFDFDEYDGNDGEKMRRNRFNDEGLMEGRRIFRGMMIGRGAIKREYETGSSRHGIVDRRKSSYFERSSGLSHVDRGAREGPRSALPFLRDKYDSDEPIRVQGKNGVLKVMVNKKKKVDGSLSSYDRLEALENRKALRTEDTPKRMRTEDAPKRMRTEVTPKRNALTHPPFHSESTSVEKASSLARTKKTPVNSLARTEKTPVNSLARTEKTPVNLLKLLPSKNGKASDRDSMDSDKSLKQRPKVVEARSSLKTPLPMKKNKESMKVPLSLKRNKDVNMDPEDSDTSLKLGPKNVEGCKSMKGANIGGDKTPRTPPPAIRTKEGKIKRGSGTEKQKLRERIREMLLNAGWTIDYRPRRNRDYLDAVYINPTGTAYWSIIKAYDALLKQSNDDEDEAKSRGDGSPFTPLADELLSQLTRKTRKKIEKEMKKKQRGGCDGENARETAGRKSSSTRFDEESMDSGSHEEKLSTFIKLGGKSMKGRMNDNGYVSVNSKGQSSTPRLHDGVEKQPSSSDSHHGRKSRKLGRRTLLVRNSNEGSNSESDGFVPYSGKRTVLSWLIDSGTVQLSQKVRYMNRRRTKVMLEGWVNRDGIHCGCCSKILTVSKFEIHAGSKLRQPFQNIYLDSGVSLLDCQIDAWNRQDSIERIGFHTVDMDGDDPNDDTCGLCGDGGDLICCDGCPSTFHLSCLDMKMLPPDDWHCPNCTCKFCGVAHGNVTQGDDTTVSMLLTCSLCAKKYHNSCVQDMDAISLDSVPCFCGKRCSQLFEQLQRYLGGKHELEAGFSWSLIHRTDTDLGAFLQGLPQRIESNSKLAVALSLMDECFLPIVDRRSGVNLIHGVLYNSGSNFNRLNFSGFYTAILERGDELISAASIRFHGTQLAEMPFIGTRHIYRRQGMCRRLFCAIESALCSLRVEKLIIPAISELMHTWTDVFGFTTLDESQKQELQYMNMLVFPGIDILQKQLLEQASTDGNRIANSGTHKMEFKSSTPEVTNKSDMDSLTGHEHDECDNGSLERGSVANELVVANSDPCVMGSSLDASHDIKTPKSPVSHKETIHGESESDDNLDESPLDKRSICPPVASHAGQDMVTANSDSECMDISLNGPCVMGSSLDASHDLKSPRSPVSPKEAIHESKSGDKLLESALGRQCIIGIDIGGNGQLKNKPELVSLVKENSESYKDGDNYDAHALNLNEFASNELKIATSVEETKCNNFQPEDKVTEVASKEDCHLDYSLSNAAVMETAPLLCPLVEDGTPCKEGDLSDACTLDAQVVHFEALSSAERAMAGNSSKKVTEIPVASGSIDSVADESSRQTNLEPCNKIGCDREGKSKLAFETVSEVIFCEESAPHISGADSSEEKTDFSCS